jgi:uncharacterized membrane protein YkvA (DUF1232 family)
MVLEIVIGLVVTFALLWVVTIIAAAVIRPRGVSWKDTALLAPDVVVLLERLARDHRLPRRRRACVWALIAWMISPIDLMPDVIPVIGSADDVVLMYLVIRHLARTQGGAIFKEHWPGDAAALDLLMRLVGVDHQHR